jgi:hypothetical protein
MESMATSKSPNVIVVFNDVQANCTRISRVRKQLGGHRFSNLIAIVPLLLLLLLLQIDVFTDEVMLPLLFCRIQPGFLLGRGGSGAGGRIDFRRS